MPTTTTGVATSFIDFTRASNATVTDSDGLVKWAPHNLLTNSESFDAAAWTQAAVTRTANQTAAPNGSITADLLKPVASTAEHMVYSSTTVSATILTYGLFVKANGYTKVALRESASTGSGCAFDLSGSGSVIGVYNAGAATVTNPSIVPLANSWFYISCTVNFASATNQSFAVLVLSPSYVAGTDIYASWLANGTDSIYAWGAHLYRSDLAMQPNTSAYPMYNPTTVKNILGYTEDWTNDAWWLKTSISAFGSGSAANSIPAPNGLQTADLLSATSTDSGVSQVFTSVANRTYTLSVYAKAGTITSFDMGGTNQGVANYWARFDLAAVTATNMSGGTTPAIVAVGNGWYRCSLQKTVTAGNSNDIVSIFMGNRAATVSGNSIYLWGAQLSDSASLDSYVPVYGAAVTSAAYYGPRRDFDPVTLACKGLLVEEQRTNSLLHTAAFDNAYWNKAQATVDDNAVGITAPDGTVTADLILPDNVNLNHGVYRAISLSAGAYTISVYARQQNLSKLLVYSGAVGYGFDLSNNTTSAVTGVTAPSSYSMTPVGGGWYRCQINTSAAPTEATFLVLQSFSSMTYTGNGADGIYLWGAQLEAGSFATSYIPTGAATATRNADVASVSTQAFPYSATAGTYVANFQTLYTGNTASTGTVIAHDTSASKLLIYLGGAAQNSASFDGSSAVFTADDVTGAIAKVASTYDASGRSFCTNSSAVATGTVAGSYSTASTTNLASSGTANQLNGWLRQVTYLPRKLSNAEIQTRTA